MSEDNQDSPPPPQLVTEGEYAGWMTWAADFDSYETLTGPYYFKEQSDGSAIAALTVEQKHLNGHGAMHGGMIMSFTDFALFAAAHGALQDTRAVTITCNTEFVGEAREGARLEARAEVVRETGSLVFIQGRIADSGKPIAAFSGTLKKIRPRS